MDTRQFLIPQNTRKLFFMERIVNLNDLTLFSLFLLCLSIHILFFCPVQYQMEMMRSLRHVNIDHLHVGWYQSTYYGSFVSRALLDSQFSYQHAIEESVVLIYGEYDYNCFILYHDFKWLQCEGHWKTAHDLHNKVCVLLSSSCVPLFTKGNKRVF